MPRYFFNLDGDGSASDQVGTVLPGPKEARSAAVVAAGELLWDADGKFWGRPEWQLRVIDEQGVIVCTISIKGSAEDL